LSFIETGGHARPSEWQIAAVNHQLPESFG
jgi:hypothetical protein